MDSIAISFQGNTEKIAIRTDPSFSHSARHCSSLRITLFHFGLAQSSRPHKHVGYEWKVHSAKALGLHDTKTGEEYVWTKNR